MRIEFIVVITLLCARYFDPFKSLWTFTLPQSVKSGALAELIVAILSYHMIKTLVVHRK